ncbi:conjugal transfer protein TrbL, partial [Salinisphaera sp. USBA-960]|nr:conjugal transfer protein TrbL [Salifodinibacter halophilus]
MILSVLIIAAPPMAGMFFNGVMSSYYGTNNFPG